MSSDSESDADSDYEIPQALLNLQAKYQYLKSTPPINISSALKEYNAVLEKTPSLRFDVNFDKSQTQEIDSSISDFLSVRRKRPNPDR